VTFWDNSSASRSRIQDSGTIPNDLCKIHFNIILQSTPRFQVVRFLHRNTVCRDVPCTNKRIKNSLAVLSVTYYIEQTSPTNKSQSRSMSTKPEVLLQC